MSATGSSLELDPADEKRPNEQWPDPTVVAGRDLRCRGRRRGARSPRRSGCRPRTRSRCSSSRLSAPPWPALAAAVLLIILRRSRVAIQAAVAALAPVAAVAIGVTWATYDMFITEHDLRILWVVLVAAGAAGMAAALMLAGRVADASRSVGEMARRLGETGPVAMARDEAGESPRNGPIG